MKYFYSIALILFVFGCTGTEQASHAPLLGTTWNLAELDNKKIQHPGLQLPQLRFEAEKVTGNDGCNNFFGGYTLDENNLKFGLLGSTRMACPHLEGFELVFNKMLSMTTRYRISGNRLDLYADEKLIASFLAAQQS